ncbi:MAG: response regulator [Planctomycetales bacterium]|nr:response regulator [Planctomycetales bacterium]
MSALQQDQAVILIIDSDPLMLTGMAAILHMQGYECHCAQTSEAAMKAASTLELDLIICDVRLKHESGMALCKRLHENGADNVPVLYVSGNQQPDVIRRAHEAGGAYYLRKPFDPKLLIDMVDKALWVPHLVQSNLMAEADGAPSLASSEMIPEIKISPLVSVAGDSSSEAHDESQHSHGAAPAPKSSRRRQPAQTSAE